MTLALTVMYKCTSNCGKNKSSETLNRGVRLRSITCVHCILMTTISQCIIRHTTEMDWGPNQCNQDISGGQLLGYACSNAGSALALVLGSHGPP